MFIVINTPKKNTVSARNNTEMCNQYTHLHTYIHTYIHTYTYKYIRTYILSSEPWLTWCILLYFCRAKNVIPGMAMQLATVPLNCMYVCMYVCICVCILCHANTTIPSIGCYMYACICACMYACMYAGMYACMYAYISLSVRASIDVSMCACMHASKCVCMYIQIYVYACMHIRT